MLMKYGGVKKIASQLLAAVTAAQKGTVFTFVYQNLIDFYLQNGFNYALTLPNSLQSLFEVYAHRNVRLRCTLRVTQCQVSNLERQ